jgi:hypothetical protein
MRAVINYPCAIKRRAKQLEYNFVDSCDWGEKEKSRGISSRGSAFAPINMGVLMWLLQV